MRIEESVQNLLWNREMMVNLPEIVLSLMLAAILAMLIGQVYIRFGHALSNRRLFARNFLPIIVTTTLVISIVKSSLALSLGLVGALSIVRFRTPIKEPEELAYLFLTIAVGLGLGAGQALITVVALVLILGFIGIRGLLRRSPAQGNLYITVSAPGAVALSASDLLQILSELGAPAVLKRYDLSAGHMEAALHVEVPQLEILERFTQRLRELTPDVRVSCLEDRGLAT
ncbi:MAG: DUF4956 domain-containing protein [Verrucomicrobiota bacterium]|nr:DUF4956 domain-containing protein [Limisphaera sp.]MDW8382182.1 DUF4956 domain-containing protein [Verrucomicrobiota bacterium]